MALIIRQNSLYGHLPLRRDEDCTENNKIAVAIDVHEYLEHIKFAYGAISCLKEKCSIRLGQGFRSGKQTEEWQVSELHGLSKLADVVINYNIPKNIGSDIQDIYKRFHNIYRDCVQLAKRNSAEVLYLQILTLEDYEANESEFLLARESLQPIINDDKLTVFLYVTGRNFPRKIYPELFADIDSYVELYYKPSRKFSVSLAGLDVDTSKETYIKQETAQELEERLKNTAQTFKNTLYWYMDTKGMNPPDVYKRANMDRRLFSKINSQPNYLPRKENIVAMGMAMKLDMSEMLNLLEAAGYTLGQGRKFDVIIKFFLEKADYDIDHVNAALFAYGETLLGSV